MGAKAPETTHLASLDVGCLRGFHPRIPQTRFARKRGASPLAGEILSPETPSSSEATAFGLSSLRSGFLLLHHYVVEEQPMGRFAPTSPFPRPIGLILRPHGSEMEMVFPKIR